MLGLRTRLIVEKLITPRLEFREILPDREPRRLPVPDVGTVWLIIRVKPPDAAAPVPVDVAVIAPRFVNEGVMIDTLVSPTNVNVRVFAPLPKVSVARPFENIPVVENVVAKAEDAETARAAPRSASLPRFFIKKPPEITAGSSG